MKRKKKTTTKSCILLARTCATMPTEQQLMVAVDRKCGLWLMMGEGRENGIQHSHITTSRKLSTTSALANYIQDAGSGGWSVGLQSLLDPRRCGPQCPAWILMEDKPHVSGLQ